MTETEKIQLESTNAKTTFTSDHLQKGSSRYSFSHYGDMNSPIVSPHRDAYTQKVYGLPLMDYDEKTRIQEVKAYIADLFEPHEYVGYSVQPYMSEEGRYVPSRSTCTRKAGELLEALDKAKNLVEVFGTLNNEAGGWIHINPLDGKGAKKENVTAYRYALVESDAIGLGAQEEMLESLQLPIKKLVYSGNKSLHAIVQVDAKDAEDYKAKVAEIYDLLDDYGYQVDRQNKNPARLTRMPGLFRQGKTQNVIRSHMGAKDWDTWSRLMTMKKFNLPAIDDPDDVRDVPVPYRPPLIHGILRRGHKMSLTGPSKAGKTFLLLELAIALSRGLSWIGFECVKSKVLYINFELDRASCLNRLKKIEKELGLSSHTEGNMKIWNLRGHAKPLSQLVPALSTIFKAGDLDAIIIDPIYKIMMGDENNATQMGDFCNELDRIANTLDCSIIYCHHHSKGAQQQKKVIDRSSGSGVFARDPDAIIDLLEIDLERVDEEVKEEKGYDESSTAWRVEGVLREFPSFAPKYLKFAHPVHKMDSSGFLADVFHGKYDMYANEPSGRETKSKESLFKSYVFDTFIVEGRTALPLEEVCRALDISDCTARRYVKNLGKRFTVNLSTIFLQNG